MTRNRATIAYIARIEASRDIVAQAGLEGAVARGEVALSTRERILRLSSRYRMHQAAGRTQAAAACQRMALKLHAAAQQEA
jgi:hypothetical protein